VADNRGGLIGCYLVSATLPRLGDLLLESGAITGGQLNAGLRRQALHGGKLGTNLVELGYIDERALAKVLSAQLKIPAVTAAQIEQVEAKVLALVPARLAEQHRLVPVREDGDRLWVAMADPTDKAARDEIEKVTGRSVRPMVAPELLILYALEQSYGIRRKPISSLEVQKLEDEALLANEQVVAKNEPVLLEARPGATPDPRRQELARIAIRSARPPRRSLASFVVELVNANAESDVIAIALAIAAQDYGKVALLLLNGEELVGYEGRGVDDGALARLRMHTESAPALVQPLASGEPIRGTLLVEALGPLGALLGRGGSGMILPLLRGRKPVGCLIAVEPQPGTPTEAPVEVATKLNHALCMAYYRRLLVGGEP
jgi:hypothetical protein